MLSHQDLKQLAQKGISEAQIERQLGEFKTGFPFLKLEAAAAIGKRWQWDRSMTFSVH